MSETLAEAWRSFEEKVVRPDAPPAAREGLRLAFHCGASWLLMRMIEIGDNPASEDEVLEAIEKLRQECDEFTESVLEGDA
jgi:hypothetical protein